MTTLLAFAFVLGVLVFVHELGHFLAAKRVGIKVLKFQLGFNPTILSFRRGDTEYGLGALPLGGYVKMAGETPEDVERDAAGNQTRRDDEFLSKTKWERFQVLIMGPVMNLLLAFVLTAIVLHQGGPGLAAAMTAGEVRQTLPHVPVSARSTLLHAYKVGFASSMDHLMVIGAIVAFVGMVGAFALVHQRDFVVLGGGAPVGAPEGAEGAPHGAPIGAPSGGGHA